MKNRCLHDQWLRERDAWPGGPGYVDYIRFVAAHPWIFGRGGEREGAARHLVIEARELVMVMDGPAPSRWRDSGQRTPSGKTILACAGCQTLSPVPIDCRARCNDAEIHYGWTR